MFLHDRPLIAGLDDERNWTGEPRLACEILPLLAAAVPAAIGIGGAIVGAATGAGKTKFQAKAPELERGAFVYSGKDQEYYQGLGSNAQRRAGPTSDYGAANTALAQQNQVRGNQDTALGMYYNQATGQAPSLAQAQFQQGLDASMRAQQSAANSARGGGYAAAAAQRMAAQNADAMRAQATAQAAGLRAQEQQAALAGYAGLAGNMRAADMQAAQQYAGMAQFDAGLAAQQRDRNDRYQLAMEEMAMRGEMADTEARTRYQMANAQGKMWEQGINSGIAQNNAAMDWNYLKGAIGAAQGAAQGGMMGSKGAG